MRHRKLIDLLLCSALLATLLIGHPLAVWTQPPSVVKCPDGWPGNGQRAIAVISDLHFGVGRLSNGEWDPTEDFRWPNALACIIHDR